MKKRTGKILSLLLSLAMVAGVMAGCGSEKADSTSGTQTEVTTSADAAGKKTFVFGDTTFNAENEESNINPHSAYCGWACIRYGVGETLMKINDSMQLEPWIAEGYELVDDLTWKITLKDGVCFSNGKSCDAEAVKKCLEDLVAVHERAAGDLKIDSMEADGLVLTIHTTEACPSLMNYLSEPYGCIIDVDEGVTEDGIVVGTGPFVATELVTDDHLNLVKNENYWDGEVPLDKVTLKCVDDQTTRSMALQTGEIDIAYNLKTENLIEFEGNDNYEIQELQSLRSTYAFMNQSEGRALSDKALRQALLRGLDKQTYCDVLLEGGATAGKAPVPPTLDFGFDDLNDENSYDPEGAKAILEEAGYKDTDGDGFVETPDGDPLTLDFVIYTSRAELGVYAQAAQASLKEIGINVNLNTVSYETLLDMRDSGQYDLLIWNVLVANTGDPENYLRENWYSKSANNTAGYNNPEVDELLDELAGTFDEEERKTIIEKIQQDIIDDAATVFFGYETTYLFSSKSVTGVTMYPMDYYWLTKDVALTE